MIAVKIQCDCGQRYAFDVEPANGRMPTSVICPSCGVDGTSAANQIIAQSLPAQLATPPPAPVFSRLEAASLAPMSFAAAAPKPPPIPQTPSPARPKLVPVQKPKRGKDGWASEETGVNKLGTYIMTIPPIFATMLPWGIMGIELPMLPVFIVVGICGMIGGAVNVMGRGPIIAGVVIGLCVALGGYGAMAWWIHDRVSVYKFELLIAFAIGVAPGFGLQFLLQKILQKRAQAAA